jgi:hypothetical protein
VKLAIAICAGAIVMTALLIAERQRHKAATKAMPPTTEINRWEVDAILRSHPHRAALVRGTGSMIEIRGGDPAGVTAVVIYDPVFNYTLLGAGTFVLFDHHSQGLLVHQLAQLDGDGWVSTGSANGHYDSGRVTRANLRGVIVHIYKIKK